MNAILQFGIAMFSGLAVVLLVCKHVEVRKWGPVFGLCGQPFWIWSALRAEQWGILILSVWYTGVWIVGIRNLWFQRERGPFACRYHHEHIVGAARNGPDGEVRLVKSCSACGSLRWAEVDE